MPESPLLIQLAALVATVSDEQGWELSPLEQARYAAALQRYFPADAPLELARRICINYHHDHALVTGLSAYAQLQGNLAWMTWMDLALHALDHARVLQFETANYRPSVVAQLALNAMLQDLSNFQFQSRLNTWAQTVIVRTVLELGRERHEA
jgi:hypothetical protein